MAACEGGHMKMVSLLLRHDASLNLTDKKVHVHVCVCVCVCVCDHTVM